MKFWKILKSSKPLQAILSSALVVIVYTSGAFALYQTYGINPPVKTPQPTPSHSPKASPSQKPTRSSSDSKNSQSSPSPEATTTKTPAPSVSSNPKSSKNSQQDSACMQRINAGYSKYNSDLATENAIHQQALAEIQDAYENGEYNDPYPDGPADYDAYQSDIDDENAEWQSNTSEIYQAWQNVQSANRC